MNQSYAETLWITRPGRAELRREALPPPGPGEVRVRARFGAISRGTERLVWRGEVPPGEWERMRAPHQRGSFPGPVHYGYISVGVVEAPPESPLHGRTVFCLHPHADRYVVPASAVTPLPDGLPPERAVLGAAMETALNALWDARPFLGERITVVGAGAIGLLCARLAARIPGVDLEITDRRGERRGIAESLGLPFRPPGEARPDRDLLVHASGNPAGLRDALRLAAFEARIVDLSWYGTHPVELPLGEAFHARRLRLLSSQVGHLPAALRARWTPSRRLALALRLLRDPALDRLVSGESRFSELPDELGRILEDPDTLCHRIRYDPED